MKRHKAIVALLAAALVLAVLIPAPAGAAAKAQPTLSNCVRLGLDFLLEGDAIVARGAVRSECRGVLLDGDLMLDQGGNILAEAHLGGLAGGAVEGVLDPQGGMICVHFEGYVTDGKRKEPVSILQCRQLPAMF